MKNGVKRVTLYLIMAAVLAAWNLPLPGAFPITGLENVYADVSDLKITQASTDVATLGGKGIHIDFFVENTGAVSFDYSSAKMKFTNSDGLKITQIQPNISGTINKDEIITIAFEIEISKSANAGDRFFQIAFTDAGNEFVNDEYFTLFIMDDASNIIPETPPGDRNYRHAADFSHTLGGASGLSPGKSNTITFLVQNRGDSAIRNAQFIVELPEGMSVYNGSTSAYIGTISIGQKVGRSFSIMVYDDLDGGKAYPVTIKLNGTDRGNKDVNLEATFYVPVTGTGAGAVRYISIENINIPSEVIADEDFEASFSIRNTGTGAVNNVKAYVEVPDGLLNKSNATFVIDSIGAGETKTFSVTMSARESSNSSYPVKIAVEPLSGDPGGGAVQYAAVFVAGGGNAKTPQLMVDHYSYGGSSVMAGKEFLLSIGFFNTSSKALSNIKVTIESNDGTFVPVDSSNSFFIDSVGAGGHFTKTLTLSAKPSAEQKTTAISVMMSYEDSGGGAFTAEDTISIPVMQVMRLTVDEIVPPYECYAGSPGASTLQFYNMGKTTLNNLMVNAEGNFDVMESNSYYVGNMEGGNSDSYTFMFIPRETGSMEGKVIFTYEDIDGAQIVHEVPFVFQVADMPVWEEMYPEPIPEKHAPWNLIIFGVILVLAAAGIIIWQRIRKAKLNKKLEIQDNEFNAAFDLEKTGAGK